mgnify:CR=1 FL=1
MEEKSGKEALQKHKARLDKDLAKQAALVKNLGGAAEMISGDEARALE